MVNVLKGIVWLCRDLEIANPKYPTPSVCRDPLTMMGISQALQQEGTILLAGAEIALWEVRAITLSARYVPGVLIIKSET